MKRTSPSQQSDVHGEDERQVAVSGPGKEHHLQRTAIRRTNPVVNVPTFLHYVSPAVVAAMNDKADWHRGIDRGEEVLSVDRHHLPIHRTVEEVQTAIGSRCSLALLARTTADNPVVVPRADSPRTRNAHSG